mmetsp:Transcript_25657/g.43582  ORF Transcript_25657/g.43582 Transcript_25657/m.43582 type:complete len:119 (-) Transcript_25657:99-455(-)|eukprot:CAMPEP_0116564196 /NCGR_PEP_ID=MMETSP0397-20121206/13172_1 /TAXON_ID=216820 /ORGANISM="Cyclophora tenuis, Strain ECT3854" /LENGTH=118 /DNA_ID=CAMNT_0004090759 /DNA_START=70 /DNA_END=423 /DNA_ORIENTATION=+
MKLVSVLCLSFLGLSLGFAPRPFSARSTTALRNSGSGQMEYLEFKIFPDGRVEEKVTGIKGGECLKVTRKINEALGVVIDSKPTEEAFEQELVIDETITQTVSEWEDGDSSWEGTSQW